MNLKIYFNLTRESILPDYSYFYVIRYKQCTNSKQTVKLFDRRKQFILEKKIGFANICELKDDIFLNFLELFRKTSFLVRFFYDYQALAFGGLDGTELRYIRLYYVSKVYPTKENIFKHFGRFEGAHSIKTVFFKYLFSNFSLYYVLNRVQNQLRRQLFLDRRTQFLLFLKPKITISKLFTSFYDCKQKIIFLANLTTLHLPGKYVDVKDTTGLDVVRFVGNFKIFFPVFQIQKDRRQLYFNLPLTLSLNIIRLYDSKFFNQMLRKLFFKQIIFPARLSLNSLIYFCRMWWPHFEFDGEPYIPGFLFQVCSYTFTDILSNNLVLCGNQNGQFDFLSKFIRDTKFRFFLRYKQQKLRFLVFFQRLQFLNLVFLLQSFIRIYFISLYIIFYFMHIFFSRIIGLGSSILLVFGELFQHLIGAFTLFIDLQYKLRSALFEKFRKQLHYSRFLNNLGVSVMDTLIFRVTKFYRAFLIFKVTALIFRLNLNKFFQLAVSHSSRWLKNFNSFGGVLQTLAGRIFWLRRFYYDIFEFRKSDLLFFVKVFDFLTFSGFYYSLAFFLPGSDWFRFNTIVCVHR